MSRLWMPCLFALVIILGCVTGSEATVIGAWNFNENNCSTPPYTALDSSGRNLNGTINGTASCVPGLTGNALLFTGNGEYIEIPSTTFLSPPTSLTLEASVKLQGYGICNLFSRQNGNGDGFTLMVLPSMLMLVFDQVGHTSQLTFPVSPFLPLNQWSFIKVQIDTNAGLVRYYLNGTLKSEQACPQSPLLAIDA